MNQEYDYIVLLEPTSPLREAVDIDNAIEKIVDLDKDSLIGVSKTEGANPAFLVRINDNHCIEGIINKELKADEETREKVIEAITELLEWIQKMNYSDIELDKYRDIRKEFKQRYSIFLIHNTEPVKDYNEWSKRARFLQSRGFSMDHIHSTVPQVDQN